MFRPETLLAFVRVSELNSFTKAAESLNLPKASMSAAIKQLEHQLGTQLIHRTTRLVQLTADGELFYERCKSLLSEVAELETLFINDPAEVSGRLRVDMPLNTAKNIVIPNLPEFISRHPKIQLEISSTDREVDVIREGFDCVIRASRLEDSTLIARTLGGFPQVNCISSEYAQRMGVPIRLEDLQHHYVVHYDRNFHTTRASFDYVIDEQEQSISMRHRVTVNNSDAYQAACLAGLGIAQMPTTCIKELLEQGEMLTVLPNYQAAPIPLHLMYPNKKNLPLRVRLFMDWVTALIKPHLA
ncbi:MAG TPA: LysR substrate-binding domain-containing protein [Cellvibrionaceae bacterium]